MNELYNRVSRHLLFFIGLALFGSFGAPRTLAQIPTSDMYLRGVQNRTDVADTAAERLLAQRQAIRSGYDVQALEGPVDPSTYHLGPGDGLYLNVYAAHSLDQDLTVTPEGKLLLPRTGQISVAGLTVTEAQAKVNELLKSDYRNPNASLSLRKLRPIKVNIIGEVIYPGVQTAVALERVSELIDKSGGMKATSSIRNIEIRSLDGALRARADLAKYYATGDLVSNPLVESGDRIYVPEVRKTITINGSVLQPSRLELLDGDSLSTAITLSKGLLASALTDSIEIARYSPSTPSEAHRIYVNMSKGENPLLQDGDIIFIRSATHYHLPRLVSIAGEVPYPGRYAIELGQTRIMDVIQRAGGVLPTASISEASLTRRVGIGSWENDAEWIRLQNLGLNRDRLTDDEYNYFNAKLRGLGHTTMVVNFKDLIEKHDNSQNQLLREEDSLYFPRARGYVNVIGSVNNQGNVNYIEGGSYLDYIDQAGGYGANADHSAVRVINSQSSSYIDPRNGRYHIGPGDTIVVPSEHPDFWKNFALVTAVTAQVLTIIAGIYLLIHR